MSSSPSHVFLRRVLWLDAATCLLTGLLQTTLSQSLAGLLGLPASLLLDSGVFLLCYGAFVAWLAQRARPVPLLVWLLLVGNVLWAVDCTVLWLGGWITPSALGQAWLTLQIASVLLIADLQYIALRRLNMTPAL